MKNKILEILDSEVLPINDKDNELTAQRICDLFDVSNQRELLIDFMHDYNKENKGTGNDWIDIEDIDQFLESNK